MSYLTTNDGVEIFYKDWGPKIVPYTDAAQLQIKLLQKGTLKIYPGYPHGMLTTHADVINADLLTFIQS